MSRKSAKLLRQWSSFLLVFDQTPKEARDYIFALRQRVDELELALALCQKESQ